MYCKYCGKQVDDDIRFCPHCGQDCEKSVAKQNININSLSNFSDYNWALIFSAITIILTWVLFLFTPFMSIKDYNNWFYGGTNTNYDISFHDFINAAFNDGKFEFELSDMMNQAIISSGNDLSESYLVFEGIAVILILFEIVLTPMFFYYLIKENAAVYRCGQYFCAFVVYQFIVLIGIISHIHNVVPQVSLCLYMPAQKPQLHGF